MTENQIDRDAMIEIAAITLMEQCETVEFDDPVELAAILAIRVVDAIIAGVGKH